MTVCCNKQVIEVRSINKMTQEPMSPPSLHCSSASSYVDVSPSMSQKDSFKFYYQLLVNTGSVLQSFRIVFFQLSCFVLFYSMLML